MRPLDPFLGVLGGGRSCPIGDGPYVDSGPGKAPPPRELKGLSSRVGRIDLWSAAPILGRLRGLAVEPLRGVTDDASARTYGSVARQ